MLLGVVTAPPVMRVVLCAVWLLLKGAVFLYVAFMTALRELLQERLISL